MLTGGGPPGMGAGVMSGPGPVIRSLSFLLPGNFPDDDPHAGLEDALQLFEFGERAGFDGAWIRSDVLVDDNWVQAHLGDPGGGSSGFIVHKIDLYCQ